MLWHWVFFGLLSTCSGFVMNRSAPVVEGPSEDEVYCQDQGNEQQCIEAGCAAFCGKTSYLKYVYNKEDLLYADSGYCLHKLSFQDYCAPPKTQEAQKLIAKKYQDIMRPSICEEMVEADVVTMVCPGNAEFGAGDAAGLHGLSILPDRTDDLALTDGEHDGIGFRRSTSMRDIREFLNGKHSPRAQFGMGWSFFLSDEMSHFGLQRAFLGTFDAWTNDKVFEQQGRTCPDRRIGFVGNFDGKLAYMASHSVSSETSKKTLDPMTPRLQKFIQHQFQQFRDALEPEYNTEYNMRWYVHMVRAKKVVEMRATSTNEWEIRGEVPWEALLARLADCGGVYHIGPGNSYDLIAGLREPDFLAQYRDITSLWRNGLVMITGQNAGTMFQGQDIDFAYFGATGDPNPALPEYSHWKGIDFTHDLQPNVAKENEEMLNLHMSGGNGEFADEIIVAPISVEEATDLVPGTDTARANPMGKETFSTKWMTLQEEEVAMRGGEQMDAQSWRDEEFDSNVKSLAFSCKELQDLGVGGTKQLPGCNAFVCDERVFAQHEKAIEAWGIDCNDIKGRNLERVDDGIEAHYMRIRPTIYANFVPEPPRNFKEEAYSDERRGDHVKGNIEANGPVTAPGAWDPPVTLDDLGDNYKGNKILPFNIQTGGCAGALGSASSRARVYNNLEHMKEITAVPIIVLSDGTALITKRTGAGDKIQARFIDAMKEICGERTLLTDAQKSAAVAHEMDGDQNLNGLNGFETGGAARDGGIVAQEIHLDSPHKYTNQELREQELNAHAEIYRNNRRFEDQMRKDNRQRIERQIEKEIGNVMADGKMTAAEDKKLRAYDATLKADDDQLRKDAQDIVNKVLAESNAAPGGFARRQALRDEQREQVDAVQEEIRRKAEDMNEVEESEFLKRMAKGREARYEKQNLGIIEVEPVKNPADPWAAAHPPTGPSSEFSQSGPLQPNIEFNQPIDARANYGFDDAAHTKMREADKAETGYGSLMADGKLSNAEAAAVKEEVAKKWLRDSMSAGEPQSEDYMKRQEAEEIIQRVKAEAAASPEGEAELIADVLDGSRSDGSLVSGLDEQLAEKTALAYAARDG